MTDRQDVNQKRHGGGSEMGIHFKPGTLDPQRHRSVSNIERRGSLGDVLPPRFLERQRSSGGLNR